MEGRNPGFRPEPHRQIDPKPVLREFIPPGISPATSPAGSPRASTEPFHWLTPHGEIAARLRAIDWSATALGPVATWPQSLRTAINSCLLSKIPMYVWWGPQNVNIYNDAYIPIVGKLRHPQFLGRPAREMWPEIWSTLQGYLDHVRSTGQPVCSEDLHFSLERNGYPEDCYFTFSFNPALDEDGNVGGALAIVQETTTKIHAFQARDAATLEIQSARRELYEFFMQAPAPLVILLGPEHRFFLANPPYERFVGRKVVGKTVYEAFTREEVREFVQRLDHVYRTGEPYIGRELPLTIPDETGELQNLFLDVVYYPFREHDGRIKGVLAFHQEVTAQVVARKSVERLALELQGAVQARDEFLSIASHELKTPITSLKLQIQLTRRHIDPARSKAPPPLKLASVLDASLKQVDRLTELVEELLDVSRIQAGKLTLNMETVGVDAILAEVAERFHDQLAESRSPLRLNVPPGLQASWDVSRMEQVFVNLLSNAVKYAPGNPITIDVESRGDAVEISVRDSGPGIPLERQKKIFERFERASSSRKISGLGLGLYIVKQIVEGHGGSIRVESAPGRGTCFVVTLPLRQAA